MPSRRQFLNVLAGSALSAGLSAMPGGFALADALRFFRIGTGPTADTLYHLATAIAAGISRPPGGEPCDSGGICGVPGLIAVAQSRSGSFENILALKSGSTESALIHADMAYWAYTGKGPFAAAGPMRDLRVLANLIPVKIHIVVPASSSIYSVTDLAGRRVGIGTPGSGTETNANYVLQGYGLNFDRIEPVHLRFGPSVDALRAGRIDAFFLLGAAPVEAILDLQVTVDIRLVPISASVLTDLTAHYPFFSSSVIPTGTYRGVATTETVALGVYWAVRQNLDTALATDITRALWQGQSEETFLADNPGAHFADRAHATDVRGIPLHPGAKRYYDEPDAPGADNNPGEAS